MHKPNNYDNVVAKSGNFSSPPIGPYIFGIVKAEETISKSTSKKMMVLHLDITEGMYKNFYTKLSKQFNNNCLQKHYRLLTDDNVEYLKGDIQTIEKSNDNFIFDFNENNLKGKYVGGMLAEEEYFSKNQEIKTCIKLRYICSIEEIKNNALKIPKIKKLDITCNVSSDNDNSFEAPLPWED